MKVESLYDRINGVNQMKYTVIFDDKDYDPVEYSVYAHALMYAEDTKKRLGLDSIIVISETIWTSKTLEECLKDDEMNRHPDLDRHCILPNRD